MDEYSMIRYTIELVYINKLKGLRWWQYGKKKEASKWRLSKLKAIKQND